MADWPLMAPSAIFARMTTSASREPAVEIRHTEVRQALLVTWLVTAVWDATCASALSVFAYHSTVPRLWQGVASTVLGQRAFEPGAHGVAVGLGLHLAVALVWSALFVAVLARSGIVQRVVRRPGGALAVASAYGPAIWLVMSLIVIPLATRQPPRFGFRWWVQVMAHVPFVTIPLVFTARRALGLDTHGPGPEASRSA